MKEGSQSTSSKDEKNINKRARDKHPEVPEVVIGFNVERGLVSPRSQCVGVLSGWRSEEN